MGFWLCLLMDLVSRRSYLSLSLSHSLSLARSLSLPPSHIISFFLFIAHSSVWYRAQTYKTRIDLLWTNLSVAVPRLEGVWTHFEVYPELWLPLLHCISTEAILKLQKNARIDWMVYPKNAVFVPSNVCLKRSYYLKTFRKIKYSVEDQLSWFFDCLNSSKTTILWKNYSSILIDRLI